MNDDDITGLAHELWALAQGVAPISDLVDLMIPELQKFAAAERERWKNLLSLQQRSYEREIAIEVAGERERCARAALRRSRRATTPSAAVALVNFANELRAGAQP